MPTVSVITPVYRGERYLSEFFDALVSQTAFSDLELVLVHNQPSTVERDLVRSFARSFRRPLSLTWSWFLSTISRRPLSATLSEASRAAIRTSWSILS